MDIYVGNDLCQLFGKRRLVPEMTALNITPADYDLGNTGNTGELCNLKGNVLTVNSSDISPQLLSKTDVVL